MLSTLVHAFRFSSKKVTEFDFKLIVDAGKTKGKSVLSWEVRFNVAVGIAEALNYMHNECSAPVIHRDVKSSNILLTKEFKPQVINHSKTNAW